MSYRNRPHIGCGLQRGGFLEFEKKETVTVVVNKHAVKKYGAKPIEKQLTKNFYRCDKCNNLVNVVVCPSWEDYVMMGKIRVPKWLYFKIRDRR